MVSLGARFLLSMQNFVAIYSPRSRDMKKTVRHNKIIQPPSQRSADRFDTELPIEIDGVQSLTRNISATGMYIETYTHQTPGSRVHFIVEVIVRGQNLQLVCEGEVVRVEQKGDKTGVAIKLDKSFFSDIEKA